jgi:hypothetical protein
MVRAYGCWRVARYLERIADGSRFVATIGGAFLFIGTGTRRRFSYELG